MEQKKTQKKNNAQATSIDTSSTQHHAPKEHKTAMHANHMHSLKHLPIVSPVTTRAGMSVNSLVLEMERS